MKGRLLRFWAWVLVFCTAALLVSDRSQIDLRSAPQGFASVAPLGGADIAVIINSSDPLSEEIGTYYQKARGIPASQIIQVTLPTGTPDLQLWRFRSFADELKRRTPGNVQAYALAWTTPYRVGCQSITSAISLGLNPRLCANGCSTTQVSPYFARGDVRRPWNELRIRPSMLLAATSFESAKQLIDRGVAADGTHPDGTAYLLITSDQKRNVRSASYRQVVETVGRSFHVRVLASDALRGAPDVMAYFTGLAHVEDIATNHYRPGAVADHLTSLGGQLTDSSQMSSLRWLEAGATGSYGTVVEPCNLTTKFPDPGLFLAYYRRGDTLLESYWRSVAMPGQGVFIGEPLARPWPMREAPALRTQQGKNPDVDSGAKPMHVRGWL